MRFNYILMSVLLLACTHYSFAQELDNQKDSLYIHNLEETEEPDKVLHAEPLYIDLIRDLGARKGEREWNLGLGLTDNNGYDSYETLIEYEWAPINRLGLEVELPFTFYTPIRGSSREEIPGNRLNSIKVAAQWSFFVNQKISTSMAIGYINEFVLSEFREFGEPMIQGNVYNPFLVIAKRWGSNFHSLIYTGPMIEQDYETNLVHTLYDINTSFHYMIPGTRNFLGIEFNKTFDHDDFDMTIRPQMRLGVKDDLMVGIVGGIPISREIERFSSFIRLIWEPGHQKH